MPQHRTPVTKEEWGGIWDRNNKSSVYSRISNRFRQALDAIPTHIRYMSDEELLENFQPSTSLGAARIKFWEIFQSTTGAILLSDVFENRTLFYQIAENPYKLMWFLTPPEDTLHVQQSILDSSMNILRKFVTGDNMWLEKVKVHRHKDGTEEETRTREINTKAIAESRKVAEMMLDRIHGSVAMNLNVKGQHAHIHAKSPEKAVLEMGVNEISALADGKDDRSFSEKDVSEDDILGIEETILKETLSENDLSEEENFEEEKFSIDEDGLDILEV